MTKEKYYIQNLNCVNKIIPTRTPKEYYNDNHDSLVQKTQNYRDTNKCVINEKRRKENVWNRALCECGKEYIKRNKNNHCKSKYHLDYIKEKNN